MRMTTKQVLILTALFEKNGTGVDLDLDQLIETLSDKYSWTTSKASMQFSLRTLIAEGLVEKLGRRIRSERLRTVLGITMPGMRILGR